MIILANKNKGKKISIIVPIYNVEKELDNCIKSIVNQTYQNIEIILVDDGSKDNCPQICDNWAKKDSRIKLIHKENGGVSTSRNNGLDVVTGEYVGFVDGDDVIHERMYEILIKLLEENSADISMCGWNGFVEGVLPKYTETGNVKIINNNIEILKNLLQGKITNSLCNKVYKISVFNNIRFPVGMTYEDMYVMDDLLLNTNKVVITDAKLYGYFYTRNKSITHTYSMKNIKCFVNASNKRFEDLKNISKLRYYLKVSKQKDVYDFHIMATNSKSIEIYNSEILLNEYKLFRKCVSPINIFAYISGGKIRQKLLKIVLLINRNLFWKIRCR